MATREVEERAVHTIKGLLLACPRLDDHLKTADSGPLTDGHIDFHSRDDDRVETFRARVSVQVKGRSFEPGSKPRASFSFQRSHLQGYLSLKGILFFVVDIDSKTKAARPYYAILNPLKLDDHLKSARGDQKNISIRVKPVPSSPEALEDIVALAHKKSDEKPGSVADLSILGESSRFNIHTDGSIRFDGRSLLELDPKRDDYLVTAETDFGEQVVEQAAIKFIPEDWLIGKSLDFAVVAGGVAIEQPFRRRLDEDTVALELNDSLRVLLKRPVGGQQAIKLQFDMSRYLHSRVETLEFVFGMLDQRGFWLGDTFVQQNEAALSDEDGLRAQLEYLQSLAAVFNSIGADTKLIDLEEITDRQYKQLVDLYDPLVSRVEAKADLPGPGRILQPVGKWRIELICFEGSEPGNFKVRHLFDPELMMHFAASVETDEGVKRHLVTPYDAFVDDEHLPYTLNLRLDGMVDYYRKISEYAEITSFATQTVLRLVNSSDQVPERRKEFLGAAMALNDWLIEAGDERAPYVINRLQIVARQRELISEERDLLRAIKHTGDPDELIRTLVAYSCSVLLGDTEEADFVFSRFEPETRSQVKTWPIWTLHDQGLPDHSEKRVTPEWITAWSLTEEGRANSGGAERLK
ncbi:hypothetical protein IM660_01010 [Ruania alkalisoli]|uniref:DUF4365 domain-containing protein n=1 Tax=Ruania alkalisoli TaxID=2779775 RepID=A0A7M1STM3_9MICO|nr:hypothetical protein [Ruania alkalisoli]QOR70929.1 hypothetical protein IM660_01010 [Ruania alkalisoli]